MSVIRWTPILGLLAVIALVPGVLAHHCISEEDPSDGFQVQATAASVPGPLAIGAFLFVPLVVVGLVLAAVRHGAGAAPAMSGRWVCTATQWVWVPDKK